MVPRLQSSMAMRVRAISCVSVIASGLAACATPPTELPPDPPADGGPEISGLTLEFLTDDELPAPIGTTVRVDDIYLSGAVIRAVGDATTQDGAPTTRYGHELHWDDDDAPTTLAFTAAPAGEYAYVELRIAGQSSGDRTEAFEIRGSARASGDWERFRIRAHAPSVIANVPAAMRLEAGRPLTIRLELDVSRLVEGIDWDALPERDGELRLDEETPSALASFCGRLAAAFAAR